MCTLPCIEVEPTASADSCVIWLHGLGADGHDFEPIVPELHLPADLPVRFVFPHAPGRPVTVNGGAVMPAWYDILEITPERRVDQVQLRRSAAAVHALIERELARGIDSRRIVIAGFSQGGAVGYEAALSYGRPLAGLLALSTYFATADSIALAAANRALPIHVSHGNHDPLVPEQLGRQAIRVLQAMGYSPSYQTYPMEHAVCATQIEDIGVCLRRWLAPEPR